MSLSEGAAPGNQGIVPQGVEQVQAKLTYSENISETFSNKKPRDRTLVGSFGKKAPKLLNNKIQSLIRLKRTECNAQLKQNKTQ